MQTAEVEALRVLLEGDGDVESSDLELFKLWFGEEQVVEEQTTEEGKDDG